MSLYINFNFFSIIIYFIIVSISLLTSQVNFSIIFELRVIKNSGEFPFLIYYILHFLVEIVVIIHLEVLFDLTKDSHKRRFVKAKELKKVRGAPLTFNGPETLKVQFNLQKVILDLERLHQVKTS